MGQGAMLAIEDAGTLCLCLMRAIALGSSAGTAPDFQAAFEAYNKVRLPRATWILEQSLALGKLRAMESNGWLDQKTKEVSLWATVLKHGTLPTLKQATSFDYSKL
jgi:2-polyprenyl-6-methoxyphenol hydroxylase-like FAD-dependent oxidoreductase